MRDFSFKTVLFSSIALFSFNNCELLQATSSTPVWIEDFEYSLKPTGSQWGAKVIYSPSWVTVDSNNNMFASNYYYSIKTLKTSGEPASSDKIDLPSTVSLNGPNGFSSLRVTKDGNTLYVADYGRGSVRIISNPLANPTDTEIGYNPETNTRKFSQPQSLASDTTGNLYVCDIKTKNITCITDPLGTPSYTTVTDTLTSTPQDLVFDDAGKMYVTDSKNKTVNIITDPLGNQTIQQISSNFNFPLGITLDKSGTIYVADWHGNNIRIIKTPLTTPVHITFGESGSGDGQFFYPLGIAVDNKGSIYVGDYGNMRISRHFNPDSWVEKGTATLPSLSLNQALVLKSGYILAVTTPNQDGALNLGASANLIVNSGASVSADVLTVSDPAGMVTVPLPITPPSSALITIATAATLNNGVLRIQKDPGTDLGLYQSGTYPILTSGTLTGSFTLTPDSVFDNTLTFSLVQTGNNLGLQVTKLP